MNDDGLNHLSPEQQEERISFYHDNNIGWVARPKNNDNGYIRKGKFKKASNMNFALNVSNKVEDKLLEMLADTLSTTDMIDPTQQETLYRLALEDVVSSDGRVKAAGDIRIGESILIIDSDTRVVCNPFPRGFSKVLLTISHSRLIACYMEPLRCSSIRKSRLFSTARASCRYLVIILRTESPSLRTSFTLQSGSQLVAARRLRLWAIMHFSAGKVYYILLKTSILFSNLVYQLSNLLGGQKMTDMSRIGQKATSRKTSILRFVCRLLEMLCVWQAITTMSSKKACL